MVDRPTTVVRRQVLDVEVLGSEADGRAVHGRLSDLCERVVRPALDDALARWERPGVDVAIGRLDIDAGTFSIDDLEHDLGAAVARSVAEAVARLTGTDARPAGEPLEGVQHRTEAQTLGWAFTSFLRTGRLPWWFRIPAGSDLERALPAAAVAGTTLGGPPGSAERRSLLDALAAPDVRARLVRQFSPAFRAALLSSLAPAVEHSVSECVEVLAGPDPLPDDARALVRHVWEAAFEHAAGDAPVPAPTLAAVAWARSGATAASLPIVADRLQRRWPALTGPDARARAQARRTPDSSGHDSSTSPSGPPAASPGAPPASDRAATAGSSRPTSAGATDEIGDEGIFVPNAGVVLLHPFLPQLFDALGVAAGDELTDPDRACCVLHLLATGSRLAPEHEVVVAKVLCGIPLDEPVEADVGLTTTDEAEAVALLEAVVGHWSALRDTSPDGLRGTFLVRPGKLSSGRDGDWLLQVEDQGVDILLDDLPWGIGMIQLPWMGRMLRVQWGAHR